MTAEEEYFDPVLRATAKLARDKGIITEADVRLYGDGLPDVTELGEPATAMFSDRYVDVEHMPREIRTGYADPIDNATSRPPMEPAVKILLAAFLIVVGLAFAMLVFGGR